MILNSQDLPPANWRAREAGGVIQSNLKPEPWRAEGESPNQSLKAKNQEHPRLRIAEDGRLNLSRGREMLSSTSLFYCSSGWFG